MKIILSVFASLAFLFTVAGCQTAPPTEQAEKPVQKDAVPAPAATAAPADHGHGHEHNEPRITLAEAKKAYDDGNAVFIDTRAETSFNNEHIKDAVNIPMESFQSRYSEVPKGKMIIAYCS